MVCPSCHAQIAEGKRFCGECGAALGADAPPSVPVVSKPRHLAPSAGLKYRLARSSAGSVEPQSVHRQFPAFLPRTNTSMSAQGETPRMPAATRPRVSTPVITPATPAQWSAPRETIGSDISNPPIKLPSGKMLGSVAAVVILLSCIAGWYMLGVELDLITDPGGAEVMLDGKPVGRTVGQGGSLAPPHSRPWYAHSQLDAPRLR